MITKWPRNLSKPIAIHGLILAGFLLYAVFLADPVFDRLTATIQGTSASHSIRLPTETNCIKYNIDRFPVTAKAIEPEGWAFIDGQGSNDSQTYIVLQSKSNTYVFETDALLRKDITRAFSDLDLDLDSSGFTALIPSACIARGEYRVGIYIRKGAVEALRYTQNAIRKSANGFESLC